MDAPLGLHVVLQPRVLPPQVGNRLRQECAARGGGPHRSTTRLYRRRVLVLFRQRLAGRRLRAGKHFGPRSRLPEESKADTSWTSLAPPSPKLRYTPVAHMEASSSAPNELAQLLLDVGADVHAEDDEALRMPSREGHSAVVQLLLERGANVHARDEAALRDASQRRHTAVLQLLIQHMMHDAHGPWAGPSRRQRNTGEVYQ